MTQKTINRLKAICKKVRSIDVYEHHTKNYTICKNGTVVNMSHNETYNYVIVRFKGNWHLQSISTDFNATSLIDQNAIIASMCTEFENHFINNPK